MKFRLNILKKLKKPSLSNDFFLIILLVIIATLFLAFWFSHKIYNDYLKRNMSLLHSVEKKIERIIIDDFDYAQYQMEYIANQIQQKGSDKYFIRDLLGTFRVNTKVNVAISWNMFSWVNKNKFITIDGQEGILSNPRDISNRDYLPYTISHPEEMHIGSPVYGAVSKQWIIPAGMGVLNKKGDYIGSIVFGFDIGNLIYKLESVIGSEGINFAILNKEKNIISKSSNFNIPDSKVKDLLFNKTVKEISTISVQSIFNKEKSFIVASKLEEYPIYILVQYDNNFSYYKFWHEWNFYMMQFIVALIFITILLFILKYRIVTPIVKLSDIAKSFSKGFINIKIPHYKSVEANYLAQSLMEIKKYIKREERFKAQILDAEKKAKKANIAKTKFLNSTSHDLKNYIIGISGLAKLILEKKNAKEIEKNEDLKLMQTINSQSEELLYFVEDLLDTNQVETGEFALGNFEEVNINNLINRIVILNTNSSIQHKVFIKTNLSNKLPTINCDIRRMKQIFSNIIDNAIKYSMQDKIITITTKYLKKEGQIYIEIADNGIGMTEGQIKMALLGLGENIDKSQLDKKIDSHGIGMPVVNKLVELHKGKMVITSKKEYGTKVKLYFKTSNKKKTKIKTIQQKSILLAEDNIVNGKVITSILQSANHDVKWVKNGKEAIKISNKEEFDLILMDGQMPIIDGYEASVEIRKYNNKIPIIALMGDANKESLKKAKESGMNDYLEKSSSKKALLDLIDGYFNF